MVIYNFQEQTPRLDKSFVQYLKDKSVAIVGRSGIHNMEQGESIDSHDVVVRVHWVVPYHDNVQPGMSAEEAPSMKWDPPPFVPEKWQRVVGGRAHIFYTSIRDAPDPKWTKLICDAFIDEGSKFIEETHPAIIAELPERKLALHYPTRHIPIKLYYHLCDEFGRTKPYGGTLVICNICRHDIETLYLTGFPCFIMVAIICTLEQ